MTKEPSVNYTVWMFGIYSRFVFCDLVFLEVIINA